MRELITLLASAGAALALTACGGGSSSDAGPVIDPVDTTVVPATAVASTTALVSYLGAMTRIDSTEPLGGVTVLVAPKSETEEPLAIK